MSFDLDRRLAAARRRLHASIDKRAEIAHARSALVVEDAYRALDALHTHLQRSAATRRAWKTRRAKGQP